MADKTRRPSERHRRSSRRSTSRNQSPRKARKDGMDEFDGSIAIQRRSETDPIAKDETRRKDYTRASPSPSRNDLAILVMGVTGSGKSTLISRLADEDVGIGHSLESCTSEVTGYNIPGPHGENIYLIDTPGFDDTHVSDVDLVRKIASVLEFVYLSQDIRFAGLIYMHRITDHRVQGSSLKSLRIFEKICGDINFHHVVLVTSMWNLLENEADRKVGETRELTLRTKDEFFGTMMKGKATLVRDEGDIDSAREIIIAVKRSGNQVVTALQREMAGGDKTLEDTTVGAFLREELEQERRRFKLERQELEEALMEARKEEDDDLISTISEQCRELDRKNEQMMVDEEDLSSTKVDLTRVQAEWEARMLAQTERERREFQDYQNEVANLREVINIKEAEHRRELQSVLAEARGNEQVLLELRALRNTLGQKTAELAAKEGAIRNLLKGKLDFSRLFKSPNLQRSHTLQLLPDTTRRSAKSKSNPARHPRRERGRKLSKVRHGKQEHDGYSSSSSSEPSTEPDPPKRASTLPGPSRPALLSADNPNVYLQGVSYSNLVRRPPAASTYPLHTPDTLYRPS